MVGRGALAEFQGDWGKGGGWEACAMSDRPWFRARASGLGWTPAAWQGWLLTILSAAAVVVANLVVIARLGGLRH